MRILHAIFKYLAIGLVFPFLFVIIVFGMFYYNRNILRQIKEEAKDE